MSIPYENASGEKETISLDEEELAILDAIRKEAPRHHVDQKLAQTYGVWTVCFRRYCEEKGVPWLWMSSVSDFMDFLDAHPNVSSSERNRALDGIMFYITDVHTARQEDDETDEEPSSVPRSTQSLFAKMLLRCDIGLTQALRLRREDVHLEEATVLLPGDANRDTRECSLPSTLRKGFRHHLERVEERSSSTNPLLFGPRREAGEEDNSTDEDIERSTEVATQVMKTFENSAAEVEE